MTKKLSLLALAITLGLFNFSIYKQEQIRNSKNIVFVKLAPVDPRSIMQGDYMRLNYDLTIIEKDKVPDHSSGRFALNIDENNVATLGTIYADKNLLKGKKTLNYFKGLKGHISIKPNTFLFQEGKRKHYEQAKYAIFSFNEKGDSMLINLADKNLNSL